jgi:hypothetical protein
MVEQRMDEAKTTLTDYNQALPGQGVTMHPPGFANISAITGHAADHAWEAWDYWIDACQRGVLFLDVLGQRSERYHAHAAKIAPHVLTFGCELLIDGRKLPRPVNYALVRIEPPQGITIDDRKRPFVIVDPPLRILHTRRPNFFSG